MGIKRGTKHSVGITHKKVQAWVRSAAPHDELRAAKGLYLRRTEAGAFWFYRYLSPLTGKQVRAPLWAHDAQGMVGFPEASLEVAGTRAANLRAAVADGIDPLVRAEEDRRDRERAEALSLEKSESERRAAEAAEQAARLERESRITVRQLFERWCTVDLKSRLRADGTRAGRKDGGTYIRQQFARRVFPRLGNVAAADVRKAHLMAVLDEVKADGKLRTCNVLLASMKQMFSFALTRDIVDRNPLDTVSRRHAGGADVLRERVLSAAEIAELARRFPEANMAPRSVAAVWLLLATGARVGELMGATWATSEVDRVALTAIAEANDVKLGFMDMTNRTWYLPTTKNQREHSIHLSDFALRQLANLSELSVFTARGTRVPWVFPNLASNGPVCVKTFGKQLADRQRMSEKRIARRTKMTDSLSLPAGRWTAHDLRRTAGTLMAKLGTSGDVIDECLNHVIESRVRRIYILDRRPIEQARAFDALGAKLQEIVDWQPNTLKAIGLRAA